MALTSADVNNQSFSIDRKGYDVDEVDEFLELVATELDELNAKVSHLTAQLEHAKSTSPAVSATGEGVTQGELDERDARIAELEELVAEHKAEDSAIAQALIVAQRSADDIIANANNTAAGTKQDAEDEAQRILDKANAEKQRIIDEIQKLQDDREDARGRYADMLTDFISSSQDILSELGAGARRVRNNRTSAPSDSDAESRNSVSSSVATYTTPTVSPVVARASKPTPSKVEKDFSGFGDTDDSFEFDDVD